MSNISNAPHFAKPSFQQTSGGHSEKKPKDHTHARQHTPIAVDPKKALQIDRTQQITLGITPVSVQEKRDLSEWIVKEKPGESLSEQDRKDNKTLRRFATILDSGRKLDGEQTKRLNEIIQRRQPPVEIPAQSTGSYAESLYSGLQSGFGLLSSGVKALADLGSYKDTLSLGSFGLSLASVAADQFPVTRQLYTGLSIAAGLGTVASGVIGLAQEGYKYLDGKSLNPWNLGNSIVQTLSGAGILTGSSAVRSASVFASTSLHAAKALHTGTFDHVGATIVGALSLAVGGDKVALANTVLTYGNLIQTSVSVWNKLEADSTQKSEVRALQDLVKILNTPVHTAADAIATTEKAAKFLQSANVGKLPQDSELGKLIHTLRQIPQDDSNTLSLLLAPLATLAKEATASNLGVFIIGGLMLGNLPGGNAQTLGERMTAMDERMTLVNATIIDLEGDMTTFRGEMKSLSGNMTAFRGDMTNLREDINASNTNIRNAYTRLDLIDETLVEVDRLQNQTLATQATQQGQIDTFGEVQDQQQVQIDTFRAEQEQFRKDQIKLSEDIRNFEETVQLAKNMATSGLVIAGSILIAYSIYQCCKRQHQANAPANAAINREMAAALQGVYNNVPVMKMGLVGLYTHQLQTAEIKRDSIATLWQLRETLDNAVFPHPHALVAPKSLAPLEQSINTSTTIRDMPQLPRTAAGLALYNELADALDKAATLSRPKGPVDEDITRLSEEIIAIADAARASVVNNAREIEAGNPALPPLIAFRELGLNVPTSAQDTLDAIQNPGDLGINHHLPTPNQVEALQTALVAQENLPVAITTEITAIKTEARRLFDAETTRIGWLTPEIRAGLNAEITAFTDALDAIDDNPPVSETAANFDTALKERLAFREALVRVLNQHKQTVLDRRIAIDDRLNDLLDFRRLELGIDRTAEPTCSALYDDTLLPVVDDTTLDSLGEAQFKNLTKALTAASTVAAEIEAETRAIRTAVGQLITEQRTVNAKIPNIEALGLASLEAFRNTDALFNDVESGPPTCEICQNVLDTRARLRAEIITYINRNRAAIATTLDYITPNYTDLRSLRLLADDLGIDVDGTATNQSYAILTSANLPGADATDATLDDVTQAQFTALQAAAEPHTIANTITDETTVIKAALIQRLEAKRDHITALPASLQTALAAEIARFNDASVQITDMADTHTLANFTTVFDAIAALNTRAFALLGTERPRIASLPENLQRTLAAEITRFNEASALVTDDATTHTLANFTAVFDAIAALDTAVTRRANAITIQNRFRAFQAKKEAQTIMTVAIQNELREQAEFNARIPAELIDIATAHEALLATFDATSRAVLPTVDQPNPRPTREALIAARQAKSALHEALLLQLEEAKLRLSQTRQTIAGSPVPESLERLRGLGLEVARTADPHLRTFKSADLDTAFDNIRKRHLYAIDDAQFVALQDARQASENPLGPLQDEVHAIKEAARLFVNTPLPEDSEAIAEALQRARTSLNTLNRDHSEDNYVAAVNARKELNTLVARLAAEAVHLEEEPHTLVARLAAEAVHLVDIHEHDLFDGDLDDVGLARI